MSGTDMGTARKTQQLQKVKSSVGFIAALDQSGGSTPGALREYGIKDDAWQTDGEMLAIVHQMRTPIITSPSFTGERILGAILFENTMDREIQGQPTADYLWNVKRVVPFLKIDKGLTAESDGVQLGEGRKGQKRREGLKEVREAGGVRWCQSSVFSRACLAGRWRPGGRVCGSLR